MSTTAVVSTILYDIMIKTVKCTPLTCLLSLHIFRKSLLVILPVNVSQVSRATCRLLLVFPIILLNEKGDKLKVWALIDQCSQYSFIWETLARNQGLMNKKGYSPIDSIGGQDVMLPLALRKLASLLHRIFIPIFNMT